MFKLIINTISSRAALAIVSFVVNSILITKTLSDAGRGETGLFTANMTFIIHLCSFVGGSALIYLVPKINSYKLIIPSYTWALFATSFGVSGLVFFNELGASSILNLWLITLLNAWTSTNLLVLLGKEKILHYNYLSLFQYVLIALSLCFYFYVLDSQSITVYYYALYIAFGSTFLLSWFFLLRLPDKPTLRTLKKSFKALIGYGSLAQGANLIQFLNYRLSYYFIASESELGIYSNAIAISEAIWLVSRSLQTIQYAKIANSDDTLFDVSITLAFTKINVILTIVAIGALIVLPEHFFQLLFSKSHDILPSLLLTLSPGILSIAITGTIVSYFSGNGRYGQPIIASSLGVVITFLGCYFLIPRYGLHGAAMTTSFSYALVLSYLFVKFILETKVKLTAFIPSRTDVDQLKSLIRTLK